METKLELAKKYIKSLHKITNIIGHYGLSKDMYRDAVISLIEDITNVKKVDMNFFECDVFTFESNYYLGTIETILPILVSHILFESSRFNGITYDDIAEYTDKNYKEFIEQLNNVKHIKEYVNSLSVIGILGLYLYCFIMLMESVESEYRDTILE